MSYCRTSSDDWRSEIHCWGSVDGRIYISVGHLRHKVDWDKLPPPVDPSLEETDFANWSKLEDERDARVLKMVREAGSGPIGGPHDGEMFVEPNRQSALNRLMKLQEMGYWVPQKAINRLWDEIASEL